MSKYKSKSSVEQANQILEKLIYQLMCEQKKSERESDREEAKVKEVREIKHT